MLLEIVFPIAIKACRGCFTAADSKNSSQTVGSPGCEHFLASPPMFLGSLASNSIQWYSALIDVRFGFGLMLLVSFPLTSQHTDEDSVIISVLRLVSAPCVESFAISLLE